MAVNQFVLLAVLGSFLVAVSESLNKRLTAKIENEFLQVMGVNLAGALWSLAVITLSGGLSLRLNLTFWMAIAGVILLNVGIRFFDFKSFKLEDLSKVYPVKGLTIVFLMISGYLILGESLNLWGIIGLLLITIGVWILGIRELRFSNIIEPFINLFSSKGLQYALGAALLASISLALEKVALISIKGQPDAAFTSVFIMQLSLGILCGIIAIPYSKYSGARLAVTQSIIKNFLLIGLFSASLQWCFFTAYRSGQVAYVGGIKRLSILFAVIIGLRFFKEKHGLQRITAATVIVAGVIIISIFGR